MVKTNGKSLFERLPTIEEKTKMKLKKEIKSKEVIPIFFATDDNYVPFLDVTLASLIENASNDYFYDIHILNTGLNYFNRFKISQRDRDNVSIKFDDISKDIEFISKKFQNIYHFSLATYYRLFIETLFPQYHKILYLDCDIVVLGDISKLWKTDLEGNMIAGVVEGFVAGTKEFREYAKNAVGLNPDKYINAGILVIEPGFIIFSRGAQNTLYMLGSPYTNSVYSGSASVSRNCSSSPTSTTHRGRFQPLRSTRAQ